MTDREKVIKGLELCKQDGNFCYDKQCPYEKNFPKCVQSLLSDALELLKAQEPRALLEPQPARLLTLEEARVAKGIGWEETWIEADEEMPETIELFECAFIGGHIICADGDIGQVLTDTYGKPYHSRLWAGNFPPTDEQRKAEPWDR